LRNAHAHNDYGHNRPLFDALKEGFTSVEADVFLMNDSLYVAHNQPYFRSSAAPWSECTCAPCAPTFKKWAESLPGFLPHPFTCYRHKANGEASYRALEKLFAKYSDILKTCTDGNCNEARFRLFFRRPPIETLLANKASAWPVWMVAPTIWAKISRPI